MEKSTLKNSIFTLYFIFAVVFLWIVLTIPTTLLYPFFGKYRHYFYSVLAKFWAFLCLKVTGLYPKGNLSDFKKIKAPVIYLFNHQSQLDILIALAILPAGFRFVAKQELFKVPFLGYSMKRCGYIPINRNQARDASKTLELLKELITKKTSILIFPEGTRSLTGELGEVKRGSIMLAFQTQTPLLPILINPAYRIMRKGSVALNYEPLQVHVGEKLNYDWANDSRDYTIATAKSIEENMRTLLKTIQ